MSQVESRNGIHWPSLFWFCIALFSIVTGVIDSTPSNILSGIGFCCMGYSSIRLVPANLFTQKDIFSVPTENDYRKLDVIIQFIGLFLIMSGLAVSYFYT
ncbi:MAG: hypothetical protein ACPG46_03210 [Thalassotalea sp.]